MRKFEITLGSFKKSWKKVNDHLHHDGTCMSNITVQFQSIYVNIDKFIKRKENLNEYVVYIMGDILIYITYYKNKGIMHLTYIVNYPIIEV